MVDFSDAVKEEAREDSDVFTESVKTPNPGGRPPNDRVSLREVSERIGIPENTIRHAQAHVETADAFPFMQSWPQYRVLEAQGVAARRWPEEYQEAEVDLPF